MIEITARTGLSSLLRKQIFLIATGVSPCYPQFCKRHDREKNAGERLVEMNYDIHVGAIGGLTGKIIAFIASLVCASLPVTGFLVWWGKRKK